MDEVRDEIVDLLENKPGLEDDIHVLLKIDEAGSWEFDDIPLDSGEFGELVSRGIAEKADGEYRLTDTEAVRMALNAFGDDVTSSGASNQSIPSEQLGGIKRWSSPIKEVGLTHHEQYVVPLLVGALLLVIGFRVLSFPAVFRNGDVVLSGNDPYLYRYWVETTLTDPARDILALPGGIAKGEPLLVFALWIGAVVLGGTTTVSGVVLAWYPVFSALATGTIVYVLGTRAFDDRRVGIASTIALALMPVHGFRASLGFADHHAFDFFWLALTLLALVLLAERTDEDRLRSRRTWMVAGLLSVAVAGQTLAWDNSPIILGAIGAYIAVSVISSVRVVQSPVRTHVPLVAGLAGATALTHLAHSQVGWHTDQVAYAPALILAGTVGLAAVSEVIRRLSLPAVTMLLVEITGVVAGWVLLQSLLPEFAGRLMNRLDFLLSNRGVAEMAGLVSSDLGTIVGPIILFGLLLFLGLLYLTWVSWRCSTDHRPVWLLLGAYAWYFLGLTLIQIRFAGELAPVLAVFAGYGFVDLSVRIDVAQRLQEAESRLGRHESAPTIGVPDRRSLAILVLLFLLFGSLSFLQTPVKTGQLTIDDSQYRAAKWIAEDAEEHGLSYPQNYVFSQWGRNRVYNYFVSGESQTYLYAQSNYARFLVSKNGQAWYDELKRRAGYVVTTQDIQLGFDASDRLYGQLQNHYGSQMGDKRGLAHYRAVYTVNGGEIKVFSLVPGATIAGNTTGNETFTTSTQVDIPGASFTYTRTITPNDGGSFSLTVPYPGEYAIGDETVSISERAVRNGTTIRM